MSDIWLLIGLACVAPGLLFLLMLGKQKQCKQDAARCRWEVAEHKRQLREALAAGAPEEAPKTNGPPPVVQPVRTVEPEVSAAHVGAD